MKTIIWKGREYDSMEYLQLTDHGTSIQVDSKIIGYYNQNSYYSVYRLNISANWLLLNFEIRTLVNNLAHAFIGERRGDKWLINDEVDVRFEGFDFIDIAITPFTNTLPIRNLRMNNGDQSVIDGIYLDVLQNDMLPITQKYVKKGNSVYQYENIPNDFSADIQVDEFDLVTNYPSLFDRLAVFDC